MNDSKMPEDFDGVFRFTNWTNAPFTAMWDSKAYTFPANKRSPMIIPGATPEQVQYIRKKFAEELAIGEFYKTKKFKGLEGQTPIGQGNSIQSAATYTPSDIAEFTQKCLMPLPAAPATITELQKVDVEKTLSKDNKGRTVSRVVGEGDSLVENGTLMH